MITGRSARTGTVTAGVLLLLALCVTGCAGGEGSPDQRDYQAVRESDRRALYDATVLTGFPDEVPVDETATLRAYVCGPEAVTQPCWTGGSASSAAGRPGAAKVMKAGARLKAELVSATDTVQVTPLGPEVQPVVVPSDDARWEWLIKPAEVGTYRLTLIVTVLRADTDEALLPSSRFDSTVTVRQTTDNVLQSTGGGVDKAMTLLTGLLTGAGGFAGLALFLGWLRNRDRRSPDSPTDIPGTRPTHTD